MEQLAKTVCLRSYRIATIKMYIYNNKTECMWTINGTILGHHQSLKVEITTLSWPLVSGIQKG